MIPEAYRSTSTTPKKTTTTSNKKNNKKAEESNSAKIIGNEQPLTYWEEIARQPIYNGWLPEQAQAFINAEKLDYLTPHELAATIFNTLKSQKSEMEIQGHLFDLLGENSFDFIQLLLKKRLDILSLSNNSSNTPSSSTSSTSSTHSPTPQITVISEQEKYLEKLKRKERKKRGKEGNGGTYEEELSIISGLSAKELRYERELALEEGLKSIDTLAPSGSKIETVYGNKMMLPEGTNRRDTKLYEEVSVPYPKRDKIIETLVSVDEFDDFAKPALFGFKTLNRIQSKIFEIAYKTNENLLVCAPTGAGKTVCALMTILHQIGQNIINGRIQKENFKIVYVAPMKALAAEMTENFSKRLNPLGIVCKELTGDMQLSKKELQETQIIVTTPEKWDVITRKSGDVALTSLVRLLIIDEVHLLHEDRGPVLEVLIARTLRQVETTQSMIRIVGLSATLPNYKDIAMFLRVNPDIGLFHFDASYRPVPLSQQFIGVKESNPLKCKAVMNEICYDKVFDSITKGNQIMVFVHSRKDTAKTGEQLIDIARSKNTLEKFKVDDYDFPPWVKKEVEKSKNKELKMLFQYGFGIHHAGMLRSDRSLTEKLFYEGYIKVLSCTATLAWGVNLPAHTVIIKGTQLYDAKQGTFIDLGMLDVMQIFGRAGRPQFDTSGEGIIITTHNKLNHYLALLNQQLPIESQFLNSVPNHLNAEIVLGTVSNIREAITWLSYTYLFVRMLRNPMAYGITLQDKEFDPHLESYRKSVIKSAATTLDQCKMIRYHEASGTFAATDLGRTASHFYIKHESVQTFNEHLSNSLFEGDLLNMISQSSEFENINLKEEEMSELDTLQNEACTIPVKGGVENKHGKVNILLQSYLSQATLDGFALVSDSAYVAQNATRILRGVFEMVLKRGWVSVAERLLTLSKMMEKRQWNFQHPLRQFPHVSPEIIYKLEAKGATMDKLLDMDTSEIGAIVNHPKLGSQIKRLVDQFPRIDIVPIVQPITRTILRVQLTITCLFEWNDKYHGTVDPWWIWIEDAENEHIYHTEYFLLNKKQKDGPIQLNFTIPIFEPLPPQYFIHAISDRWLGAETVVPMSFKHLILPHQHPPHTELLDLQPLPVTALHNADWESLYKFTHFNPIQTQVFHTLYHTNHNVLLGAPTGSGKTITAEIAIFKLLRDNPNLKVVYIGPLKALVRERLIDWSNKFGKKLGKKVIELTGDYTPNIRALQTADIVVTTPEKWDGISRNWQQRSYVKSVGLVIIDEIHLLGEERGPILEVIVSRMRYISSQTDNPVRIIGLSTALANARDLGDWLGIEKVGLFNFKPAVRPVPIEAYIQGYSGKHYCPRMLSMNRPAYSAILSHSNEKPVLIFVSSRRQTRLTALDLISYCAAEDNPRKFLHMDESELDKILYKIKDSHLKHTLTFGVALHHAGLTEDDKNIVEDLFGQNKIQVLVSTSTLAWGVNLPAHLVIIKGTEFFDPKMKRYVDYPITDVLQMMGRAGRPQFDTQGKAVIMVHEPKKNFYKKFLYEPFPVESSLPKVLHNHINAEIVGGTISSKQDAIDYLTWTYFFRRLLMNPTYYNVEDASFDSINKFLSEIVDNTIQDLELSQCVQVEDDIQLIPTTLGRIASFYYLHYSTMQLFKNNIHSSNDINSLLNILTKTTEYEELPVRHNEEKLNAQLATEVPWPVDSRTLDSPHTKAFLLLQAHFEDLELPISDFITDTKSVLDQAVRILQAMVDVSADRGALLTALNTMHLLQMIIQGQWLHTSPFKYLPNFTNTIINSLHANSIDTIPELLALDNKTLHTILREYLNERQIKEITNVLSIIPIIDIRYHLQDQYNASEEIQLTLDLNRLSKASKSGVYAPRFPKFKDEGWWLVIGDNHGDLVALRKINFPFKTTKTTLSFDAPDIPGEYEYSFYFMSDSYIGIDQQYSLKFNVK